MTRLGAMAAACCVLAFAAQAETMTFKGDMSAANEVPPTGTSGTGVAQATLDTDTGKLHYDLTWKDLTGPATAAHFHGPAGPGQNAPVLVPVGGKSPTSPASGDATLTPEQMKQLEDGQWYANVHTAQNPKGEIRGQMAKQ